jgi:hypothetical protein
MDYLENIDLDINNYETKDILYLFKLDSNFDKNGLKMAKEIVLKTHPDKSKLPSKYFIFFHKAYKMLHSMYIFKNNIERMKTNETQEYKTDNIDETFDKNIINEIHLKNFFEENTELKNHKKFNIWFNKIFENNRISSEIDEKGYGDWLKTDEDINKETINNISQIKDVFERKKHKMSELIVKKDIDELYLPNSVISSSDITGEAPEDFNSDIFTNLPYQDLKKAHTETLIPVSENDFKKISKFNTVDDYIQFRGSQNIAPFSTEQSKEYLNKKNQLMNIESTERAFKLAKQMEEAKDKSDKVLKLYLQSNI